MDGIGRVIASSAVRPRTGPPAGPHASSATPRDGPDSSPAGPSGSVRRRRGGWPPTPLPPLADCTSTCSPTGVRIYSYADADRCDPAETSSGAVYVGLGVPAFEVAVQGPREFWHLMVWASCGRVVLFGQGVEVG